jgi:phosphoribosylamine--glycine ligase
MRQLELPIMKVLLVGSGGREHALAWTISRSKRLTRLFAAPGNPGIAAHAECVDLAADDVEGILEFARRVKIDLTVVGPEAPLVKGLADAFLKAGLRVFGPTAAAAELEGSKVFCKNLLRKYGIPTAGYRVFTDARAALEHLKTSDYPVVVKADGLAAGKGVVVAKKEGEASEAVESIMLKKVFGKAGDRVVIEECLVGQEASLLALTDGKTILLLESAQDHKRIFDDDRGPNTGGMGAYSPTPVLTASDLARVEREVFVPVVHAMNKEGRRFKGILYAGLMLTANGPKVLEFNVRFGDPETQAILPRLRSDLLDLMERVVAGTLSEATIEWDPRPAVCVVMAAKGYPGKVEAGQPICGLEEAGALPDTVVFHAGTARKGDTVVAAGGRVLGVTAVGKDLVEARHRVYTAVRTIRFEGAQYRTDIGAKALK